jgi:ATP-dependent protease HslVU (ClpYQ) peptidase subunit
VTVIAGLVDNGTVLIGGDSAGVAGYQLTVRRDSKTFVNGPYVLGFTSSFRMGQILRHTFTPPTPPSDADIERFMCTTWIDAVRNVLKGAGWALVHEGQESGGTFLVGIHGRLFEVNGDYQVGENLDGYAAVGCGDDVALGALYATADADMAAEDRVVTALRAAERFSAGVRGPFTLTRSPAASAA